MELKRYSVATKSPSGRVIRFIGSDESLDRDGDTIAIDGWDVSNYMKNPVVLFGHDAYGLPVGKSIAVTADKRARQLLFDIEFPTIEELSSNPKTPSEHALKVDAIYNMAKAGILNTVSVGFRGLDYESTATGRAYKRQELMEISIVPIPANPNAVAIMRAANIGDSVMKGVFAMTEKGNRRLSKESVSRLGARLDEIERACGDLRKFMADDIDEDEGEPDDKAGKPNVGEESGPDENAQQPDPGKMYVIEIVEKAPTVPNEK